MLFLNPQSSSLNERGIMASLCEVKETLLVRSKDWNQFHISPVATQEVWRLGNVKPCVLVKPDKSLVFLNPVSNTDRYMFISDNHIISGLAEGVTKRIETPHYDMYYVEGDHEDALICGKYAMCAHVKVKNGPSITITTSTLPIRVTSQYKTYQPANGIWQRVGR